MANGIRGKRAAEMGERYQRVIEFEESVYPWAKGIFLEERLIFSELAELFLEPLEYFPESSQGWDAEQKSVVTMLISRMFNDFKSAKTLILRGLCEQAYMPLRDAIECMGLIRLCDADPERARRWVTRLAEYFPHQVEERLTELGIKAPEYAFYGLFSRFGHANLLGTVTLVKETELGKRTLLRSYHFGGYANTKWMAILLQLTLLEMLLALIGCLSQIYVQYHPAFQEWRTRAMALVPRLQKCGVGIGIDWSADSDGDDSEMHPRLSEAILKVEQKLFDMDLINEAETADIPVVDAKESDN